MIAKKDHFLKGATFVTDGKTTKVIRKGQPIPKGFKQGITRRPADVVAAENMAWLKRQQELQVKRAANIERLELRVAGITAYQALKAQLEARDAQIAELQARLAANIMPVAPSPSTQPVMTGVAAAKAGATAAKHN